MRTGRALAALRPELLAYARSLTLDETAAEDLAHDAVLRGMQAANSPADPEGLRPWAFRIVRNLFLDTRRRARVRMEYSSDQRRLYDGEPATAADPVEALVVRQAFDGLADREREILCLVDILGLTYAEAGAVLEIPVGTVMSRVSRARRAMADRLGESNVRPLRKMR